MTQDEIIEMARQAGICSWLKPPEDVKERLEAFAKLVAAKATEEANARANASWTLMCEKMVAFEREACAKIVEENANRCGVDTVAWMLLASNAQAIRARGET